MSIRILYFAGLREKLGLNEESVSLPEGLGTLGELKAWLCANGREALAETPNLRFAVNQNMARETDPVLDGDEVAFFPPVTGG